MSKLGTMVLFGQHSGKPDPRFPLQLSLIEGDMKTNYISCEEHEALLEKQRAKARALVEALTSIETFCPEGRISIVPQKAIQAASQLAREALAAWKREKDE